MAGNSENLLLDLLIDVSALKIVFDCFNDAAEVDTGFLLEPLSGVLGGQESHDAMEDELSLEILAGFLALIEDVHQEGTSRLSADNP